MNPKLMIVSLSIIVMSSIGIHSEVSAQENNSLELLNMEENQKIGNIKDFKEDRDKAKEWADKEFEKWNKELKNDQREALKEVDQIAIDQLDFGIHLEGYPVEDKDRKKDI